MTHNIDFAITNYVIDVEIILNCQWMLHSVMNGFKVRVYGCFLTGAYLLFTNNRFMPNENCKISDPAASNTKVYTKWSQKYNNLYLKSLTLDGG